MNPERLLQNFDRLIDTPDAVPRLRRFILDLAVRGKLVEQNPEDEPAGELLKRIEAEKRRRFGSDKKTQQLDEDQIPFTIPGNWQWTQLAQIGVINPRNDAEDSTDASFIPMPLIFAEYGRASQHDVRPWSEIKKGFTHFAEGDVGLAKITPCFENGKSTVFRKLTGGLGAGTTELHIVRPILVLPDYILLYLKTHYFIETGIPKMTGTAGQKRVPKDYFSFSPFPLPPLAEQHRIVAKVDELMKLCDELEATQAKREKRRDRLVAATLHGLNNGNSDSEASERLPFEDSARFYFNHLPRLTTRPEHIQQLCQTILSLAVRGKLVPQNQGDEPVVNLRKRIEADSRRSSISAKEQPFDAPATWMWVRYGDLSLQAYTGIDRGKQNQSSSHNYGYFKMNNILNRGGLTLSNLTRIDASDDEVVKYKLRSGDFLFNTRNSRELVGKTCVFEEQDDDIILYNNNILRSVFDPSINPKYIDYWFQSGWGKTGLDKLKSNTTNVCAIYQSKLFGYACPIPPSAEQHRIVAKVDELMALCNEIETRITTNTTTSRKLLEATLQEAVSGNNQAA